MTETIKTVFPKGLAATLDVKDRILTLYQKNDLKEVYLLQNLNDEWIDDVKLNGEIYSLNIYKDKDGFRVDIYATVEWENEILSDMFDFENVKLDLI